MTAFFHICMRYICCFCLLFSLHSDEIRASVSKLNNSILEGQYRHSLFANAVRYNFSEAFSERQEVTSSITEVDKDLRGTKRILSDFRVKFEDYKLLMEARQAEVNFHIRDIENKILSLNRTAQDNVYAAVRIDKRIGDEVAGFDEKHSLTTSNLKSISGSITRLDSAIDKIMEEKFNSDSDRNRMSEKLDAMEGKIIFAVSSSFCSHEKFQ